MTFVRAHLRTSAVAWLVCHVLMFSAVVPRDCCAAHAHAEASASAPSCHDATPSPAACRLTGTCDAPAAALAAVLLQGTAPLRPLELTPRSWIAAAAPTPPVERPLGRTLSPDAPPPRA